MGQQHGGGLLGGTLYHRVARQRKAGAIMAVECVIPDVSEGS